MKMSILLLVLIIVVTIAGLLILFFYFIKQTHRISGPIFIMTRCIDDLLEGETPDMRRLREKGDFKEFYSRFRQLAERVMELKKKEHKG